MPTVFALARFLGLQGILMAAALVFYEGLPGANYVTPYLRIVPALGPMVDDLAQGRVGRSRLAGRQDERLVWEERSRRAEIVRQQERRAAQIKIDEVERDYWSRSATDALKISELEKTLAEDDDDRPAAAGGGRADNTPGPALSKRLRDALDAVGRD